MQNDFLTTFCEKKMASVRVGPLTPAFHRLLLYEILQGAAVIRMAREIRGALLPAWDRGGRQAGDRDGRQAEDKGDRLET